MRLCPESRLVCGHKIQGVFKEYSSTKKTVFKGNSKQVYLIALNYVLNFALCYYRLKIAAPDMKCILIKRHYHQWNVLNLLISPRLQQFRNSIHDKF